MELFASTLIAECTDADTIRKGWLAFKRTYDRPFWPVPGLVCKAIREVASTAPRSQPSSPGRNMAAHFAAAKQHAQRLDDDWWDREGQGFADFLATRIDARYRDHVRAIVVDAVKREAWVCGQQLAWGQSGISVHIAPSYFESLARSHFHDPTGAIGFKNVEVKPNYLRRNAVAEDELVDDAR